jgi:hypothetical protein
MDSLRVLTYVLLTLTVMVITPMWHRKVTYLRLHSPQKAALGCKFSRYGCL